MAQVLLVANRNPAAGQTINQMDAWLLDVADGSTAQQTALSFATDNAFPFGSTVYVIDLTQVPAAQMTPYLLTPELVAQSS